MSFLQGLFGPPNIDKLKAKHDVQGLIKALSNQEDSIRCSAAIALGELGDPSAAEVLVANLPNLFEGYKIHIPLLFPFAESSVSHIPFYKSVMDAVIKLAEPAATTKLASWLARFVEVFATDRTGWNKDFRQWHWILNYPPKIGPAAIEPILKTVKSYPHAYAEALCKIGLPAEDALISALKSTDKYTGQAAAVALATLGDRRAVEPLIDALKTNLKTEAAEALATLADVRAVEPLIAALQNTRLAMEQVAAKALGKLGDARAVEPLIAALSHKYAPERAAAAEALGAIGDSRAIEPLKLARERENEQVSVRAAATKALMKLGSLDVALLMADLQNQNSSVRIKARKIWP